MATTPDLTTAPPRVLDHALLDSLVDDAALFPPALCPLDRALRDHLAARATDRGVMRGPLLVSVSAAGALRRLLDADPGLDAALAARPLQVLLVARPGTDPSAVAPAVATLADRDDCQVVGLEVPITMLGGALGLGLPLAVEVPRRPERFTPLLPELVSAAGRHEPGVRAKYRTQAFEHEPVPSATDLAHLLTGVVDAGLQVKLTGGLHHAIGRGLHPGPAHDVTLDPGCDPMTPPAHADPDARDKGRDWSAHGLLNVFLAVEAARAGSSAEDVRAVLAMDEHEREHLVGATSALVGVRADAVRATFTAFGCCDVDDPLDELAALGLLPHPAAGTGSP